MDLEMQKYLEGIYDNDGIEIDSDKELIDEIDNLSSQIIETVNSWDSSFYFCRHWETDRNKRWIMNPWDIDSELNKTWEEQAKTAWIEIQKSKIIVDFLLTSPLVRAVSTWNTIAAYSNGINSWSKKWVTFLSDDIREMFWWKLKNLSIEKLREIVGDDDRLLRLYYKSKKYNWVESVVEFDYRVTKALYDFIKDVEEGVTLISWHSWTWRVVKRILEGSSIRDAHYKWDSLEHSMVYKLDSDKKDLVEI